MGRDGATVRVSRPAFGPPGRTARIAANKFADIGRRTRGIPDAAASRMQDRDGAMNAIEDGTWTGTFDQAPLGIAIFAGTAP